LDVSISGGDYYFLLLLCFVHPVRLGSCVRSGAVASQTGSATTPLCKMTTKAPHSVTACLPWSAARRVLYWFEEQESSPSELRLVVLHFPRYIGLPTYTLRDEKTARHQLF